LSQHRSQFLKQTFSIRGSPNPRDRMAPTKFWSAVALEPASVGCVADVERQPEGVILHIRRAPMPSPDTVALSAV
jgi:hypothetical protein